MSLPDIHEVARRINSPLFQGARQQFHAAGGKYRYIAGNGTHYLEDEENPRSAGEIVIDPDHVRKMGRHYSGLDEVVRAILIHEMGHFMYRTQDRATQPKSATEVDATVSWCLKREAHASMFAYRVVKELKARNSSATVLSPSGSGDLFSALAEAERSGKNMLQLAHNAYTSNPHYALYCRSKLSRRPEKIPQVRIVGRRPAR